MKILRPASISCNVRSWTLVQNFQPQPVLYSKPIVLGTKFRSEVIGVLAKGATKKRGISFVFFASCWLSFNYLVRAHQECLWDAQPDCLRGLEVHDHFEPGGKSTGSSLGGVPVRILCTKLAARHLHQRRSTPLADQRAGIDVLAVAINRGQPFRRDH